MITLSSFHVNTSCQSMLLYIVSVYYMVCVFCEQDMFEIFNKSTNNVEKNVLKKKLFRDHS